MARDQQAIGPCPDCSRGPATCFYNRFSTDVRTIHSWEHRCTDCGHRLTQAFRTDDSDLDTTIDPMVCPFCSRHAAP